MTFTVEEMRILKQLMEQASVPVTKARAVVELYDKLVKAIAQPNPPDAAG